MLNINQVDEMSIRNAQNAGVVAMMDSGRDGVFRWQLLDSALAQHVGPRTWGEPGP